MRLNIYGSPAKPVSYTHLCAINNDGTLLYRTGLGHGDAMHVANLDPDRPGYQVWEVHEEKEACQTYGIVQFSLVISGEFYNRMNIRVLEVS